MNICKLVMVAFSVGRLEGKTCRRWLENQSAGVINRVFMTVGVHARSVSGLLMYECFSVTHNVRVLPA